MLISRKDYHRTFKKYSRFDKKTNSEEQPTSMASFLQNPMMQGSAAPPANAPSSDNGKMNDLSDKLDKQQCYGRNIASAFPMTNLFIGDTRLGCKSDADEQLILHIAFNETVKVSLVSFCTPSMS